MPSASTGAARDGNWIQSDQYMKSPLTPLPTGIWAIMGELCCGEKKGTANHLFVADTSQHTAPNLSVRLLPDVK